MSNPTVFLSAASDDLRYWRDVLHKAFARAGCMVYTQEQSLGASAGDVPTLLRQHIDKSDFVVHLAGLAYGSEAEYPLFAEHPDFRCSYTQFEYYYAHQQDKPVIAYVCAKDFPYLSFTEKGKDDADRERRRQLQQTHRERVAKGRFDGTPLEGEPHRPLSESIADIAALLQAVSAAVGTILGFSSASLVAVQNELNAERKQSGLKVDISRIDNYAPAQLVGREAETMLLHDAWGKAIREENNRPRVLTFVALGGEGKTSLVAKWVAELAHQGWPGCDAAFAWSFHSQGTREQVAASSDLFLKAALLFFGDADMANSAQGAFDKGRRLAQLVGERRALLILDGVEPLQYAPTSPTAGELKDQGLAALLKGLAANSRGLCVVTTRYTIADLRAYWQTTAPEHKLLRLSQSAGVALLQQLGVKGNQKELETLVQDVQGHALTLNLIGSYLRDAHAGDIRKRDLIKLEEADAEEQGGHAFRVMDAYAVSFEREGEKGQRALALLRLLGLFDRPADAGCLAALWQAPVIAGLTEPLLGMSEAQRNLTYTRLASAKLLTVNRDAAGTLLSLDAHPLLREYFGALLRQLQPEVWREGHRRLYEHLCASTRDKLNATLEDLQPLYQAVAHGCQAGLRQESYSKVYLNRILQQEYSTKKLGAFGLELGAIACMFETTWNRVSCEFKMPDQAWLFNAAAFRLRALGRLTEAVEPMRAGLEVRIKLGDWSLAAMSASNLSELELALGDIPRALKDAEEAVTFAGRIRDTFSQKTRLARVADVLHQAGRRAEAEVQFRGAEDIQVKNEPSYPLLYSLSGFYYCDLLLTEANCIAWQRHLECTEASSNVEKLSAISRRAAQTLRWSEQWSLSPLNVALNHLTVGRAALYRAMIGHSDHPFPTADLSHIDDAVTGLRLAGTAHHLPRGLLTRAWLRSLTGPRTGPDSAQSDLDEAWEIAERGPMKLHMADIHLYRARLFFREAKYPWVSPAADLAAAEKLINDCGYHRRDEELADAKRVILRG